MRPFVVLLSLASLCLPLFAEVANMSGSWWLNAKRSRWGSHKNPPNTVALTIEHSEPALKYSGTMNARDEDAPIKFEFNGMIDGKEHSVKQDQGERKVMFKRRSDHVVESVTTMPDGNTKEYSTLTMSDDGKTLERKMEVREGDRVVREWTEIYEKRQ